MTAPQDGLLRGSVSEEDGSTPTCSGVMVGRAILGTVESIVVEIGRTQDG